MALSVSRLNLQSVSMIFKYPSVQRSDGFSLKAFEYSTSRLKLKLSENINTSGPKMRILFAIWNKEMNACNESITCEF